MDSENNFYIMSILERILCSLVTENIWTQKESFNWYSYNLIDRFLKFKAILSALSSRLFRSEFIIFLCLQLIVFIQFLYSVHNLSQTLRLKEILMLSINLESFCHPTTFARYNCRFILIL